VLAVHGTTASHRAFTALARRLSDRRVVAPDLRGRGRSAGLPAPYGLRRHAEDLERALDALGVESAPVVGHSLGAFVAVALADRIPGRVERLVLVDGGIPLARPEGVPLDEHLAAVLGPAAARLRQTFADRAAYHALWRAHPALAGSWGPDLEDYVDYDLVGEPPALRSATVERAVLEDGAELYGPAWYLAALRGLRMPVSVLRAPRDLLDREGGLYPPGALDATARLVPQCELVEVLDVNHYTILFDGPGLDAVATAVTAPGSPASRSTPPETKESR
jgi:pimeloyl-ACP methyl ester carboxylesterase